MSENDRLTGLVGPAAIKVPCAAASTVALTLSGEQTIDGVACVTGDRILVKNQASAVDNGIYVCDTGTWERSKDADGSYDFVQGSIVLVYSGGTNGNKFWKLTTSNPVDVDSDSLVFTAVAIELVGVTKSVWAGTAGGTANVITLTPAVALAVADLTAGLSLLFKAGAAANSGAVTINVSGTGAIAAQVNGAAMVAGDIEANQWYHAMLDGSGAAYQVEKVGIPTLNHASGFDSTFALSGTISPSQITGNQNDYSPTGLSTANTLRLTSDASRNITGIAGGAAGRILVIYNVGSFPIVFTTDDASSTAANRMTLGASTTLAPTDSLLLQYDATSSVWRKMRSAAKRPSQQIFTSGTAATYTKPAGATRIRVRGWGGGAGGAGATANNGTAGNATSFDTLAANGGAAGITNGAATVAAGGTASGGDINIPGEAGANGASSGVSGLAPIGGKGGATAFIGVAGQSGGPNAAGGAGPTNTGAGGGGGGGNTTTSSGGGGGGGGYFEKVISSPAATYTYSVGATVSGGAAGGAAGGAGAAGLIIVDEFYD